MRKALRFCMVCLVLTNLGFVHITEAARLVWLLPLIALTVASPVLLKLTRFWAYRLLWNLSVLGAFALLVHHVTYAGVSFLLEDGLLLAALCQVHLLNNLSDSQKPDLVFFNSFLIAVVTSYLSLDLGYSLVFLVYAPLFVVSLQLLTLSRAGVERASGVLWPVVRSGLARGGAVVAVTLVVFFFFPRDFSRRGLLGETLNLAPPGSISEVAFSEQVNLDQSRQVQVSDRIVMQVRTSPGSRFSVPSHWRGATLDEFNGTTWKPTRKAVYETDPWRERRAGVWERGRRGPSQHLDVYLADPKAWRVFLPLESRRLEVRGSGQLTPLPDRNFKRAVTDRRPLRYSVELALDARTPAGRQAPLRRATHTHIALNPSLIPRDARRLARELRAQLPDDAHQHQIVAHMSRYLETRYRYLAPGADGGARTLERFLAGDGGAHCEYFATALAVMLRGQSIPSRVVTGYRSEEWDDAKGVLTVRARHAHAWVEVLDPQAGWYAVDPTPAVGASGAAAASGLFGRTKAWLSKAWTAVTGFNDKTRDEVFAWLAALPARILDHALATALSLGGLVLAFIALRLRRRRGNPVVRRYRRCVKRLGLVLETGETPRALLERARRTAFPAKRLRRLEEVTRFHEQARYVPQPSH